MGVQAAIMGASAINGAIQGRKSAKERRASIEQDRADRMEGYNFSKPYIQRSYDRAEDALNSSLEKGAYKGQTYADQNPYFSAGNHYMGGMGAVGCAVVGFLGRCVWPCGAVGWCGGGLLCGVGGCVRWLRMSHYVLCVCLSLILYVASLR